MISGSKREKVCAVYPYLLFMIVMVNGIRGWLGLRFPDICLTAEEKPRKNPQLVKLTRSEIELGSARRETTTLENVLWRR